MVDKNIVVCDSNPQYLNPDALIDDTRTIDNTILFDDTDEAMILFTTIFGANVSPSGIGTDDILSLLSALGITDLCIGLDNQIDIIKLSNLLRMITEMKTELNLTVQQKGTLDAIVNMFG